MNDAAIWKQFFASWPDGLPQKGVVITNFDEQVVFVKFLMADDVVMLERQAPDSVGGRRLLIPYGNILGIKVTEPVKDDVFVKAGYSTGGRKRAADRPALDKSILEKPAVPTVEKPAPVTPAATPKAAATIRPA